MSTEPTWSRRALFTACLGGRPGKRRIDRAPKPASAEIQPWLCLAHRGQGCSACGEHCPLPGAVVRENGMPRIEPSVCDGCGICADVCPAPLNAILMHRSTR